MLKKFLIIAPSWVGDTIMAQALLQTLKIQNPDSVIDVLAPDWSRDILQRMLQIRNILSIPIEHGKLKLFTRLKLAQQLRQECYDCAIVLPNSWKSALIPYLARIPQRIGWLGELRYGLLNDIRYLNKNLLPMMVQRYVALAYPDNTNPLQYNKYPIPSLRVDRNAVVQLQQKFNLPGEASILALCPGAAFGPAKRWPIEYFAQLANEYAAQGWEIWFFGSKQDQEIINNIQQQLYKNSVSFAGKISLTETVDLLSLVSAVVSNDSGLMHLAASLQRPLVAIYGSSSPEFTPPLGSTSKILYQHLSCSPCFQRTCKFKHYNCLRELRPEIVSNALLQLRQQCE